MDQKIKIKIEGRPYDLTAKSPQQEEMIRKSAEMLNKMIAYYGGKYSGGDRLDILSIVAINQCMGNLSLQKKIEGLEKEIAELGEELEGYLKNIGK